MLDKLLDHIAQIGENTFEKPNETEERTAEFVSNYEGSYLDLFVMSSLLSTIAETLRDGSKSEAYTEALLEGHESKFNHKGIDLTPVESHYTYEFVDDEKREKYLSELDKIAEAMKPFKKKEKAVKKAIKSREEELVEDGKATLLESRTYLKVSKK